ncbi:hypothetical protein CDD81_6667 [Ophiocordyceps australis]|uniref:FAD-binding domain-containing protein n=1 Tax=Ophiocordyceps australis TaxID=1399860 RepID=A0A2C5XZV6_9HYPO|nr:hypothetical protein CDD81_6667 [Ophiocordyceps australis]
MALEQQPNAKGWRRLNVGIIGGGIGGMCAAIALRRAGHDTTIYEKSDYAGEVGASVSCAANGTRWLYEWRVDVEKGDGVVLKKLINRDWRTGEEVSVYDLSDYEARWGYAYNLFHRVYMHKMLMESALQPEEEAKEEEEEEEEAKEEEKEGQEAKEEEEKEEPRGPPARLLVNHGCCDIDLATSTIIFTNGSRQHHDLIIGADGIGSAARTAIGVRPDKRPAEQSCLHANVTTREAVAAGLVDYSQDSALEYWGGQEGKLDKIVLSPCNKGTLLSYYCFFPRHKGDYASHAWGRGHDRPVHELLRPFGDLDPQVRHHLAIGKEIRPWRMWIHEPYAYITRATVCLLGDAAHPMMPHQSQGACMAIEDAAALGIVFGRRCFDGQVDEALATYQAVRLPRATRVQAAAAKAMLNINERIGFSVNKDIASYRVDDPSKILTIEEMNLYDLYQDIDQHLAARRRLPYHAPYSHGLPKGYTLPNGVTIGDAPLPSTW